MKFNYRKTFLLGFGFFGVSVIWGVYNAFVPLFLSEKFNLSPAFIGFFMTLDNIVGPNVNGWIIQLTGNYNSIMVVAPIFMVVALILMLGVHRGEAKLTHP